VSWPDPRGGFFLWATLPEAIDADRMIPRAVSHGVIYVAGEAFYVNGTGSNTIRLSFSAPVPERIRHGVARLATAIREELDALSDPAGRQGSARPAIP
jgi:DNA-binding transcriptional MocR family regulator